LDQERLTRLRSGDEEAFRALVLEHQDRVVNICYRFLRDREDARDTAQDVFLEVYRALPGFRGDAELATWIYRIATTKSLDALRRRKRKKRLDAPGGIPGGSEAVERAPAEEGSDPGRILEDRERARILENAVATLPRGQRIALTLAKYEGMRSSEIAGVLGTSVGAVDSLVYRAQFRLRQKLTKAFGRRLKNEVPNEPSEAIPDDV
jgi:RNA polymerase sigma-70 factor, ECF subfamily